MNQKELNRDFSQKTINALTKKGIRIYGRTWLPKPNDPMPMVNGESGYKIDDNGTSQIKTWTQIMELAK